MNEAVDDMHDATNEMRNEAHAKVARRRQNQADEAAAARRRNVANATADGRRQRDREVSALRLFGNRGRAPQGARPFFFAPRSG